MESHLEARLWNDVFTHAEDALGIPHGTIRATVLIETIPAAFEMDEILYELREHASGPQRRPLGLPVQHHQVLPRRRPGVRAARPRRGHDDRAVHAGLHRAARAHLPPRTARSRWAAWPRSSRRAATPEVNERALAKVREDKQREAGDGFDGSWVAHPDLVPVCREVFDAVLGDAAEPARPHAATTSRPTPRR